MHIDVGSCRRPRMLQHSLNILYRALLLSQCRNRSTNDLEGEPGEIQVASELVEYPLAVVPGNVFLQLRVSSAPETTAPLEELT